MQTSAKTAGVSPPSLQAWTVPPLWVGETAVCIGGGPSLTTDQINYCRGKARIIAINNAFQLAPWADVLYACDLKWWQWYPQALQFAGEKITQTKQVAQNWPQVRWIRGDTKLYGLSRDPSLIHCGHNGGYQAINLAYLFGARRIVLIGYDMRVVNERAHWFGDHPDKIRSNYGFWRAHFKTIADQRSELGLEIINCTPDSALTCFPMRPLHEVF